jgi:2-methylaconitate isomerase
VGAIAINGGLVDAERIPDNGICKVRIWQKNIQKTIIAHVPITNGEVQEAGAFELDGVAFPAAEIKLDFLSPGDSSTSIFPTGNLVDQLDIPGVGSLSATMISAGIPTIFLNAEDVGYSGCELQEAINTDSVALQRLEAIRAHGAVKMGLISDVSEAVTRQHTPKLVFCAPAQDYVSSSGKLVSAGDIDLCVRALSMGKLHHAMMGTAAVAIGAAAAIPGTLINLAAGGGNRKTVSFGHPSGTLAVGAEAALENDNWVVDKVSMTRSARIIMDGWVRIPADTF